MNQKENLRPPSPGRHPMCGLRMPPELKARLDTWIARQPDPKPSRSEAIRRLLGMALEGN